MLAAAASFAAGLFAWTFLEYAIHGWIGHRLGGPAHAMHDAHHRDPGRVFAIGAWPPLAIALAAAIHFGGFGPATTLFLGTAAGFALYEIEHYRIHFVRPACGYEARLRARHLGHHYRAPARCLGVTSALWDRVFASEPEADEIARMGAAADAVAPLPSRSNLGRIVHAFGGRRR